MELSNAGYYVIAVWYGWISPTVSMTTMYMDRYIYVQQSWANSNFTNVKWQCIHIHIYMHATYAHIYIRTCIHTICIRTCTYIHTCTIQQLQDFGWQKFWWNILHRKLADIIIWQLPPSTKNNYYVPTGIENSVLHIWQIYSYSVIFNLDLS